MEYQARGGDERTKGAGGPVGNGGGGRAKGSGNVGAPDGVVLRRRDTPEGRCVIGVADVQTKGVGLGLLVALQGAACDDGLNYGP